MLKQQGFLLTTVIVKKYIKDVDFKKEKKRLEEDYGYISYSEHFGNEIKSKTGFEIEEIPENDEAYYIGASLGDLDDIKDISLEDLLKARENLSKYFPETKARFYGEIING